MIKRDINNLHINIGFYLVIIFFSIRPFTLMLGYWRLGGLTILDIFGVGFSYFILTVILLNFKNIIINRTSILIIIFCLYTIISFLWGSSIKEIAKLTFPFLIYYAGQLFVKK